MEDIDEEWEKFCEGGMDIQYVSKIVTKQIVNVSDLYISTRTIICHLNRPIDLNTIFWLVPIIEYSEYKEGIIKKQMKFSFDNKKDLEDIMEKTNKYDYFENNLIRHIENPEGRIHFKDVRKISIGISKKDILTYRTKKKGAFYNCFVLISRIFFKNKFTEVHVKIFNTGKIEIPGIQDIDILNIVLEKVTELLNTITNEHYNYNSKSETVLINSNFNCGYHINRQSLYDILKIKYNIICGFDPCSYPGIQCKIYYDNDNNIIKTKPKDENITKMSIMIFRTGSVIIVGKCEQEILYKIYNIIKNILIDEYEKIVDSCKVETPIHKIKNKRKIKIINTYA